MPHDGQTDIAAPTVLPELHALAGACLAPIDALVARATQALAERTTVDGIEAHQTAAHALAWLATYGQALTQLHGWADRLAAEGKFGEVEQLILQIGFGEYLNQIAGGIPASQGEIFRLADIADGLALDPAPAIDTLRRSGNTQAVRGHLAALIAESAHTTVGASGLNEEMEMIRDQFRRFVLDRIAPSAHGWHLNDTLIPTEVITEMAEMGVFGLTIPEEHGGFGLSKTAMCVVSEELSRGWIGVGSLGTRSEIAAELILGGGTEAQKQKWLPLIASAEVLPTAVFTEPNTGSDLGSLSTRAVQTDGGWAITGNKTWITHAARAGVMTVLARTDPDSRDYRGLSMFLAEKTPGTNADPFPDPGITGGEIEVLGYRGMKEYELGFDGFAVAEDGLLGGVTGQGFKQLMRTFESARIQTAARAIGVAQSAMDLALSYAQERKQFGQNLIAFPRVAGKIAMMAVEIAIARQLTYHSAREKDADHRCDLEAGMAKLLAARVAWAAADNGVQIHGGNGFALEYPISRVLCDARILSIFEGAAEIQAHVIARRLLK